MRTQLNEIFNYNESKVMYVKDLIISIIGLAIPMVRYLSLNCKLDLNKKVLYREKLILTKVSVII